MSGPPPPEERGELRVHVSYALGLGEQGAFVQLQVADQRKATRHVNVSGKKRALQYKEDVSFAGSFGVMTSGPLIVSVWHGWHRDSAEMVGEGKVDLRALIVQMDGKLCGVPLGDGQVRQRRA